MAHIKLKDDADDDEYELSESEDEYTAKEKSLLNKVRQSRNADYSDDEDSVYNLESDDDSSNDSNIAVSDIDGQDDDNLPNIRAWGKDKRNYYATDYVDPDYGGYQGKDAALADLEEEEARNLQMQLAQQLDDNDFSLEDFGKKVVSESKLEAEVIKTDFSELSNRQKLQLLQKESPEFFNLVEDFKVKMVTIRDYLKPVLNMQNSGKLKECDALDFVKSYQQLILNYCTNIYMYMLLKSSKVNMQSHPVIKRLYQYRQLLEKMDEVFIDVIKPQISILLQAKNESSVTEKKKTLKLLSNLVKENKEMTTINKKKKKEVKSVATEEQIKDVRNDGDKREVDDNSSSSSDAGSDDNEMTENVKADDDDDDGAEVDSKRAITYQIAKNKGLMPHRKKEQRNPRVKHRNRFRKAKIRRKGAVREVRKELKRYGGEISGIKAGVTKSIKIKS